MGVNYGPAARLVDLARQSGARVAVIYEGHAYSYAELAGQVRRLVAQLRATGCESGDRVLYLGGNSVTFLVTFLASAWIGAVFVPVNSRLGAREVRPIAADAEPHTLVVEPGHRDIAESCCATGELGHPRMLLAEGDPMVEVRVEPDSPWDTLPLADERAVQPPVPCDDSRIAMLTYTSGTTGKPKGVVLTHANLWWNGVNLDAVAPIGAGDVNLVVAPLFHTAPLGCFTIRALSRGATTVLRREFDAAGMLADLVTYRVTAVFAPPAMWHAVAAVPGFSGADLSAVRAAVTAGAPATRELIAAYGERGIALQQGYGLTETLFATCLPSGHAGDKAGAAGFPLPHTDVRVIDPDTAAPVNIPGECGEICLRAPTVTAGYRGNDAARAASFHEGWFRTGDVGYLDDDGCLYLVDRLKDVIIVGGNNVYSAEVESVLSRCPGVRDVAVVGVADPHEGESVVAIVAGDELSLGEVRRFAGDDLASYKLPAQLVHAGRIPRNNMGKIDKVAIRAALASGDRGCFAAETAEPPSVTPPVISKPIVAANLPAEDRPAEAPASLRDLRAAPVHEQYRIVFEQVHRALADVLRQAPARLHADDRLPDLGLGSLAAVELARRLSESFRVDLPATTLFEHASVGGLVDFLCTTVAGTPTPPVLDLLTRLERAVAEANSPAAVRAEMRSRLQGLLNRLAGTAVPAEFAAQTQSLRSASEEQLFDLVDRILEAHPAP